MKVSIEKSDQRERRIFLGKEVQIFISKSIYAGNQWSIIFQMPREIV